MKAEQRYSRNVHTTFHFSLSVGYFVTAYRTWTAAFYFYFVIPCGRRIAPRSLLKHYYKSVLYVYLRARKSIYIY